MSYSKFDQNDFTLRILLENPELLEVPTFDELSCKEKGYMSENNKYDTQSAFLGPAIWQDTIPPEFLDLPSDSFDHIDVVTWLNEQSRVKETNISILNTSANLNVTDLQPCLQIEQPQNLFQPQHCFEVNFEHPNDTNIQEQSSSNQSWEKTHDLNNSLTRPQGDRVSGLSNGKTDVSMRAIVGDDSFDASKRSFTSDELRVAPILPKSQKNFVPFDKKDDHYWTRRLKNNTAAKRSREAKRMKDNQITLRTAFLEQENSRLKVDLTRAIVERDDLKKRLMKYEYVTD